MKDKVAPRGSAYHEKLSEQLIQSQEMDKNYRRFPVELVWEQHTPVNLRIGRYGPVDRITRKDPSVP